MPPGETGTLSRKNQDRIVRKAYLPEHLRVYGEAISGGRAHLHGSYLCYECGAHLIFVGYPLDRPAAGVAEAFQAAWERFQPATAAMIAPEIDLAFRHVETHPPDDYYRINLPPPSTAPKIANMLRRAGRELEIVPGRFQREHRRMVNDFIQTHSLSSEQISIYRRIDAYLKRSQTARVLEARKGARLAAFNIVDFGSTDFAFYMFNFRSTKVVVPGASDLLFYQMLQLAQSEAKQAVNLGLGLHPGVRRFKEKWGGRPFLRHCSALVYRDKPSAGGSLWGTLAEALEQLKR
jgi:hypothetical protein